MQYEWEPILKKSDLRDQLLGQARTPVPREGVDEAISRVYENAVNECCLCNFFFYFSIETGVRIEGLVVCRIQLI